MLRLPRPGSVGACHTDHIFHHHLASGAIGDTISTSEGALKLDPIQGESELRISGNGGHKPSQHAMERNRTIKQTGVGSHQVSSAILPAQVPFSTDSSGSSLDDSIWALENGHGKLWNQRGRSLNNEPFHHSTQLSGHSKQPLPRSILPGTPGDRIEKYQRLLQRLQWKCNLLIFSHRNYLNHQRDSTQDGENAATQFKLDFFEFYSLLERTLVYLLDVFRISVRALDSDHPLGESTKGSIIGNRSGPSMHRYHANVLQALSEPGPLQHHLGRGLVLDSLLAAKNLRNKWKEAGERLQHESGVADGSSGDVRTPDVRTPDVPSPEVIQHMMETISEGMLGAKDVLQREIGDQLQADDAGGPFRSTHGTEGEEDMFDSMEDVMEID